jgi:hypothetical protein
VAAYSATVDAYTLASPPKAGTGAYTILMAGDTAHDRRTAFLSFPVPVVPLLARNVQATLVLNQVGVSRPGTAEVRTAPAGWATASPLSIAGTPTPGAVLATSPVAATGTPTSFPLPAAALASGPVNLAVDLAATVNASSAAFASSDSATVALRPSLVLQYTMPTPCSLSEKLVPTCGALLGSTDSTLAGETSDLQSVARQESEMGRTLDIVHVYKRGADNWPTPDELTLINDPAHPRTLLVNWKPEQGATWAQVAAGSSDALIDAVAARINTRLGSTPFFLTVHHEPEDEVVTTPGSGFTQADYVAMFRHVMLRLRADGATSFVSVWDTMGYYGWGTKGYYATLYPGDDVVDWIAYDPYSRHGSGLADFANQASGSFPGFYTWSTATHPSKPLMLAETGVSDNLGQNSEATRANVFSSLVAQAKTMPALKAIVYFDHAFDGSSGGSTYSWESSPQVLAAAKAAVDDPYFNPRTGYLP